MDEQARYEIYQRMLMERAKSPEAKAETIKRINEIYEALQNRTINSDYYYLWVDKDIADTVDKEFWDLI